MLPAQTPLITDWIVAGAAVATVLATGGAVLYSGYAARKLVADERKRHAGVAASLVSERLRHAASEAKAKAAWLREHGAPPDLGDVERAADKARKRLQLATVPAVCDEIRTMIHALDPVDGMLVTKSIAVLREYNDFVNTAIDTREPDGFGSYFRQSLEEQLKQKLDVIALNADMTADRVEKNHPIIPR